jgi:hypothetical protein
MSEHYTILMGLWRSLIKGVKKLEDFLKDFALQYPNLSEAVPLTFIYLFALFDLIYSLISNLFSLGYFPEIIKPYALILKEIFESPLSKIRSSPEKVFFMSFIVLECTISRPVVKFSKLVKYNILLVFALLMVQGLVLSYWDLFFNREIPTPVTNLQPEDVDTVFLWKLIAMVFFVVNSTIYVVIFLVFYFQALSGQFGTIKKLEWLTDSIAFWLRIKTKTIGNRKKRK